MRFATKILLLTLAMTVGLSGIVVWVVTTRITTTETQRARVMIRRASEEYAENIELRQRYATRIVHLLLEEPQTRALLQRVNEEAGPPPEATLLQLRDEIFGSIVQTELARSDLPPAFHVLVNSRGGLSVISAPAPLAEGELQRLRTLHWPYRDVIAGGPPQRLHLVMRGRLYLAFGIPVRVEIGDEWAMAHFVAYEIDDRWLQGTLGVTSVTELRALVQLGETTLARSAPPDAAERRALQTIEASAAAEPGEDLPLDFIAGNEQFTGQARVLPSGEGEAIFALFSSLTAALAPLRQLQREIAMATGGVIFVAVVVSQLMSRLLARPVEQLVAGAERIGRGEFKIQMDTRRRDELGTLARSFNQMAVELEQRDLIKDTFGKFVDPSIVRGLLEDPASLKLGGERRVQTILFADLEGFTVLSERLDPETLFQLLNGYLETVTQVVTGHRGIIDKFIGDGVIAFWGPPLEPRHAARACLAALELVQRMAQPTALCLKLHLPPLRVRVGLATGEVLVGNIGSNSKYNYTVMGDIANLASRLEGANKLYGTQLLVTGRTVREAGDSIVARRIDTVRVIGRSEPVELYEILAPADTADGRHGSRLEQYQSSLELYQARRWSEARERFERIDDPPSRAMAARCAELADQPPGVDWDGVWNLERK
jgi:class 3 adenylate cyclase